MPEPKRITLQEAFGDRVIVCPDCGHGIDAHGIAPGGPCGVGDGHGEPCPCLRTPNGVVCELLKHQRCLTPNPLAYGIRCQRVAGHDGDHEANTAAIHYLPEGTDFHDWAHPQSQAWRNQ